MRLTRYQPEPPSAASYNCQQDSCHHCQPCFQLTEGLGCDVYIEATGAGPSVKWVEKQLLSPHKDRNNHGVIFFIELQEFHSDKA